jgi:hypothetical protein
MLYAGAGDRYLLISADCHAGGNHQTLLAGNAADVYGFDTTTLAPLAAGVGPRIDEIAQSLEQIPADSASPAFSRA